MTIFATKKDDEKLISFLFESNDGEEALVDKSFVDITAEALHELTKPENRQKFTDIYNYASLGHYSPFARYTGKTENVGISLEQDKEEGKDKDFEHFLNISKFFSPIKDYENAFPNAKILTGVAGAWIRKTEAAEQEEVDNQKRVRKEFLKASAVKSRPSVRSMIKSQ